MIKKRRTYTPRIVGGKVMMPADIHRGEPSAVLLGYAAADDLWSQSALLL